MTITIPIISHRLITTLVLTTSHRLRSNPVYLCRMISHRSLWITRRSQPSWGISNSCLIIHQILTKILPYHPHKGHSHHLIPTLISHQTHLWGCWKLHKHSLKNKSCRSRHLYHRKKSCVRTLCWISVCTRSSVSVRYKRTTSEE